jgi:RNA polymerase sigma-70 factor (ECF subfamily)
LSHHDDASDCFQATFVAAWRLACREPVVNWPAALRRLATARALEILRSRIRRKGRSETLPDGVPDGAAVDPREAVAARELEGRLLAAVLELPPAQAEIVCLVCIEGMSNADAATALGLSANHVGVQLHRARQALKSRLEAGDSMFQRRSVP